MFECSSPEVPNEVVCHLALTTFPLACQELGQLQKKASVLADIAKMEREDKVENYSLSKGTLYCRSSQGRDLKLVVPAATIPISSPIFTLRRYVVTWVFLRT